MTNHIGRAYRAMTKGWRLEMVHTRKDSFMVSARSGQGYAGHYMDLCMPVRGLDAPGMIEEQIKIAIANAEWGY